MNKIVLVFVASFFMCVGASAQEARQIYSQYDGEASVRPPFPATLTYRKALTGPGYVLVFNTTIKQDLPAVLTIISAGLGTVKKVTINLTWEHSTQLGHLEGVVVYPGDRIILENNQYEPFDRTLVQ